MGIDMQQPSPDSLIAYFSITSHTTIHSTLERVELEA
jgi:hypothetical protein